MPSLVYSDPVAAGIYWATYLVFILIDARLVTDVMIGRTAARATSAQGPVHRPVGIVWLVSGEALGLAAAFIDTLVLPGRWAFLIAGVVLAWCGILIRVAAKRTLGRFFVGAVVIQDDHRVVTEGPYTVVRHPGYAGSIIALVGLGLATANVLSILVFTGVALLVFVPAIKVEEATLTAAFGDAYIDYSRDRARLVPGLW
jgi:protein-S-isoprenylcysteine O-methyltransferase Ste14